ncbi:MAG: aminodeoxychorismate/anthranilate synthase component II [Gammaproteobacteria bacterium]|nr:aminodeoxychorismate/anthranilate synthase component II [Gammaproteobacteria bacterium]
MLLLIDNYDSFTYNVAQYLGELGAEVAVHRNDEISLAEVEAMAPERIVLSPGPCTPNEAGVCLDVVRAFGPRLPLLGICLGHQCIGQAFGGDVVRAEAVMHGKTSLVHHEGEGLFAGLPAPLQATRYHSLVVARDSLPSCLEMTAWTERDGAVHELMGCRHRQFPIEGVQFHPESIFTESGHDLLRNFLNLEHRGA